MLNNYRIKNVTFCSNRAVLSNGEQQQELNFTEAKLLEILLSKVNETVLKETLKEFAWQHTVVTDSSLTKSIAKLRKALVFFFEDEELIITIPRVGYKFVSNDVVTIANVETSIDEPITTKTDESEYLQTTEYEDKKKSKISVRNKILLTLSILLIGGSLFNFLRLLPSKNEQFIAEGYHVTELTSGGFSHTVITRKGMELNPKLSFLLSQQKCNCLFFVDKISGHYNISYFDPKNEKGKSFIFDEKNLVEKLRVNLSEGEQ
ncbi:winged helix-turn-helix domain-containing protein [Photobacterium angustum]|uniref:winged helix-turn-helix domain-containing protein n=1 Tax=Photobacterium angustum TaxID=661 RepID=UPI0005E68083|nr:winged helix-turn-helix domain-containing protein [Photobacterium angustum]KJG17776.1 hypothetical protein UA33_07330 [Photobacterium angustum]KJG24984.1 hypothetical protein UA39_06885 [Photobacterium angustum]KJG32888.1 hypothetical protein UA36_05455 [Photobacterium angustum]PSW97506.1 hypothetical protein C0W79_04510 [Photobacterium angustum]PSX00611.1 hypothetical protein C0W87_17175 [Photobacterium angustum]